MAETRCGLVALGGNQPFGGRGPAAVQRDAMDAMASDGIEIVNKSFQYQTPCFPAGAGPDYVNSAVQISVTCDKSPTWVLQLLHRIEADFGRTRETRWGQRSLDLDLLALGDMVLPDASTWRHWRGLSAERQSVEVPNQLILPHPRLQDRAFVLVPLADVAPDWRHPVLGRSVSEMLHDLPQADREAVRRL